MTVADDLTIDADVTIAMDSYDLTVTGATNIVGTLTVAANTLTLNGASDVDGTITVSTGTVDANGTFDATGGTITITGEGNLQLAGAAPLLGTNLSTNFGKVTYDGAAQTIFADTYYDLTAGKLIQKHLAVLWLFPVI